MQRAALVGRPDCSTCLAISASAGRGERRIRNIAGFSRFLNFVKEFIYSAVYIVLHYLQSKQLCLSGTGIS